jgi:hypothetical protein
MFKGISGCTVVEGDEAIDCRAEHELGTNRIRLVAQLRSESDGMTPLMTGSPPNRTLVLPMSRQAAMSLNAALTAALKAT